MQREQIKDILLKATGELLDELDNPEEITSRRIAEKAGVNLAMINYCFKSKDELVSDAVGKIIMESAENPINFKSGEVPPIKRLWHMLWELCELVFKFEKFTSVSVPYILLKADIEAPLYILPMLREHFGSQKTEAECRVIAYELISFMQLVFYRGDEFYRYSGLDISNIGTAKEMLKMQFDIFFGGGNYE